MSVRKGDAWLLLPGFVFGVGLAVSGMTDPARVLGFLDVTGRWDPTLALVMAGALGSFALLRLVIVRRGRPVLGGEFPASSPERIDPRLLAGSAVFGIGWGLAGFCPGPGLANLGAARSEALVFVVTMAVGMFVAQRAFGADTDDHDRA